MKFPSSEFPTPNEIRRLRFEFEVGRSIGDVGGLPYLEFVTNGSSAAIVMDDAGSDTLERRIALGPPSLDEFFDLTIRIAAQLEALHRAGFAHGDVKPANLLTAADGRIMLCDFGNAVPIEGASRFTSAFGTLAYIAPEQTGRTDRVADHRSDLYSLGATAYHVLVGRRPFTTDDPLELLRSHLAQRPPLASTVRADVPRAVDAILDRLLAKDPSDRYQTARGLRLDLERARDALASHGSIADFELGEDDVGSELTITTRVVGREAAIASLLSTFDRHRPGTTRFLFVRGPSGIGKSAVVGELRPRLVARRAHFCQGKFDELRRHVPYSAIFDAVRQLLREFMTLPPERLETIRVRLLEAVGSSGRLLTDALPELGRILHEQPPVAALSAADELARFARAAGNFIAALSTPEEPLVLFLDDLQWADDASLRLLESFAGLESATMLVLGAYRDDEVGAGHPFALTLLKLASRTTPTFVDIGALELSATLEFLRQSFRPVRGSLQDLAAVLHEATGGNPFHLRQILASLHRDGLVRFDVDARAWTFDVPAIARKGFTENVVALMVTELGRFAPDERRVLGVAAAIGSRFDLPTLAKVAGSGPDELEGLLASSLRRRYLVADEAGDDVLRFSHDRIYESAYELVAVADRPRLHLLIGRISRARNDGDVRLFDVVSHLNEGRSLVDDAGERASIAEMNIRAARAAKASNAWDAALHHLDIARELLGENAFERDYERWLTVMRMSAETNYVLGDESRTESEVAAILSHARTVEDRASAYRVRLLGLLARGEPEKGIVAAKELSRMLGIDLPDRAKPFHVVVGLMKTKWRMRRHDATSIGALPRMTDANALTAMEVLAGVISSSFFAEPELFPVVVFEMVRLTLEYGVAPTSPEGFSSYGMVLASGLNDIEGAVEMVRAARNLLASTGATHRKQRVGLGEGIFVAPWVRPIRASVEILVDSYRSGIETGDVEFASIAMSAACFHAFLAGDPLDDLDRMIVRALEAIRRTNHRHTEHDVMRQLQFVRNLRGVSVDPLRMVSAEFDESADLARQLAAGAKNAASALAWYQATLALVFRDLPRAKDRIDAANRELVSHQGTLLAVRIRFVHAIVHLQCGEVSSSRKTLATFRKMAESVPSSFGHMADLIDAELARVRSDHARAAKSYDLAVRSAREHGMHHDAALAAELAARHWLERGVQSVARAYLVQSRHHYLLWGAMAKVVALDAEFGRDATTAERRESSRTLESSQTESDSNARLDLDAAIRASNAIAAERTVEGVTRRVLACLVGDAGAERAVLLAVREHGLLELVAECGADGSFVARGVAVDEYSGLPLRIVRYVQRAHAPVVLRHASVVGEYTQDPYIAGRGSKSIVCAPVGHQGQLVGIIYLENDLAVGAFSRERLELVTMLAAQAAVSIANAELYESLELRVRQRTDDLEVRNRFIRQIFGRYLSNDIVDSLLERPEGLSLVGEKRRVTILMCDLRGFSGHSERLSPEQVVRLINNFLSEMTDVIQSFQGTIDEFIGDAILTIFGAPIFRRDDAERAVACALAMQEAMTRVNAWNVANGLPIVEMGVGVNTGEVVVGNIGSQKRAKYGVVGSPVNLASRIESYTYGGQVLISESTRAAISADVRVDARLVVHPKGSSAPLTLLDVGGLSGTYARSLDRSVDTAPRPVASVDLEYTSFVDKASTGRGGRGALVGLSSRGALVRLESAQVPLSDLRIRLLAPDAPPEDIVAKVISSETESTCLVRFTSLAESTRRYLDSLPAPS